MNCVDLGKYLEDFGGDILSFCYYLTKNKEEAEDLCQDTFLRGFELAERIEDETHAKRFFLSVAVWLWKNKKRKFAWRRRILNDKVIPRLSRDMDITSDKECVEQEAAENERRAIVRECVDMLPERERVAVLLFYTEGLKEAEIADVLKIPVGTVKSRLHRARHKLYGLLSERL